MFKPIFFIPLLALIACTFCSAPQSPITPETPPPKLSRLNQNIRIIWYTDSLLTDVIFPYCFINASGGGVVTFPYVWDYTGTALPGTFWGTVEAYFTGGPLDTLNCLNDTAWTRHSSTIYDVRQYKASLADAILSEKALRFTKLPFLYLLTQSESSLHIWNNCIDTVLTSREINLPKLPYDTNGGFWLATTDTFFCSASLINRYEDRLNTQIIKSMSH